MIFGDLRESTSVMFKLGREIIKAPMTAQGLKTPAWFMAVAIGLIGVSIASTLWAQGHSISARTVMKVAVGRSVKLDGRGRKLVPGFGCAWHALLLLDMGAWEELEDAVLAGELADAVKRNRETGMLELIHGRMLSAKSIAKRDEALAADAVGLLRDGLVLVERNRFRWWQCAFHLALGRHHAAFGAAKEANEAASACEKLARETGFKLMIVDALLLRCKLTGDRHGDEMLRLITKCGYGAARRVVEKVVRRSWI
jgi:hypothetical protein